MKIIKINSKGFKAVVRCIRVYFLPKFIKILNKIIVISKSIKTLKNYLIFIKYLI